jgi:hypothetical protein
MALMNVGLCPEILTEDFLYSLRRELNIQTVKDFLSSDPQKIIDSVAKNVRQMDVKTNDKTVLTLKDINSIRDQIFSKFSIVAKNVGEEFSSGRLSGSDYILTGLNDLVTHSDC